MQDIDLGKGICVWGAGEMTRRVWQDIGADNILAIIDGNPKKIGQDFEGKPVISLADYQAKYAEHFILITPYAEPEIESMLESVGIELVFRLSDCPSEFSLPGPSAVLRNRLMGEMKERKNIAVYGRSLYAVLLSLWYGKKLGKCADVYLPAEVSLRYLKAMQREFPQISFYAESQIGNAIASGLRTLFVADEWDLPVLSQDYGTAIELVNAFDITDREESYLNPKLQTLKGTHNGESCFVIGLGPSLRAEDLTRLHECGVCSISMNSIPRIFNRTPWRPTYYAAGDIEIFDFIDTKHPEDLSLEYSFMADVLKDFWKRNASPKNLKFHVERNMPRREPARFSDDISRVARSSGTIAYICIQIAAYMGFSRIYLLGLDNFDPSHKEGQYGHFYQEKEIVPVNFVDKIDRGYIAARQYADSHGIKIINATRGGCLEAFDRVDFDSLFVNGEFDPEQGVIHHRPPLKDRLS